MLAVFYGTDTVAVRQSAHEYVVGNTPVDSTVTTIDTDSYQRGMLAELAGGTSLFGGTSMYVIDTPSNDEELYKELEDQLEVIAASPHHFILIEGPLLAAQKKELAKHAELLEEYKRESDRGFNVFALADALSRKDKKLLWMLLHDALRAGLTGEELVGTLWWQLKTLRLAASTSSAGEAGMKEFPYSKAKRALGTFKEGELESLSRSLLSLYHDARLGKFELDLALERWVLSL